LTDCRTVENILGLQRRKKERKKERKKGGRRRYHEVFGLLYLVLARLARRSASALQGCSHQASQIAISTKYTLDDLTTPET
jgi:hypothetical protein